ncbi:MAG: Rrf2 family transcriptional regulator [Spirochaetales bacterium]|nr:Rrf2 family transcriptional regulator [Spirochaetales bacterium]
MLTLSSKGIYGLNAMLELVKKSDQGPVQIKYLSEKHNIPQHYLEQIMVTLKKNKLVKSFRGQQGGYILARKASEIKIIDVLQTLEGELKIISDNHNSDGLSFFWKKSEKEMLKIFSSSLLELKNQELENNKVINYVI